MDDIDTILHQRWFDDAVDAADDAADEARRWLEWLRHALGVELPDPSVRRLSDLAYRNRSNAQRREKRMLARAAKSAKMPA